MWQGGVCGKPMVDKPAAVAKAPFCKGIHWFQRLNLRATTKWDLLTLAKDSMVGIMSDIELAGTTGRELHGGGRSE